MEHIADTWMRTISLRDLLLSVAYPWPPLLAAGADTLVLGCTHYPFLLPVIQELAGPDVCVVESSAAVAREIARRTQNLRHPLDGIRMGATHFYTTADPVDAQVRITALWGQPVLVQPVVPDHNP